MKKYLRLLLMLFVVFSSFFSSKVIASPGTTTLNFDPINSAPFRWRNDVDNTLSGASSVNMNWSSALNGDIPSAELGVVYRIRMGQNFKVSATQSGSTGGLGDGPVTIRTFTIGSPISYLAEYSVGTSTTYKQIPTSLNTTDPFYMKLSATGLQDGDLISYKENYVGVPVSSTDDYTGRKVLPAYFESGRPANPYYFIGGVYYGSTSSKSAITTLPLYTGATRTISTDQFLYNKGTSTNPSPGQQTVSPTTFVNFGVEIESSIGVTTKILPNTKYNIRIKVTLPVSGTGTSNGNSGSFGPETRSASFTGSFMTPAKVLPVSLKSFVATKQGTSALLNWVTASEINNKGFYVQRSSDGKTFNNLGFVSSLASGGNSNTTLNYSYTDATPSTGAVYYRLNQVDLDGTSKYSDIQSLFMGTSSSDVMVAPNPVVSNVNLNNAQVGADYAIYSMSGQLVKSGKVTASVMSIDASNLASGMYVIKTSTNAGAPVFKKFIKK